MVELHGWLAIRETYADEDLMPEEELKDRMRQVEQLVRENPCCGTELQYKNGFPYLTTLHAHNHFTAEDKDIISLYQRISEIATGSYGVLYLWDDEDREHGNEFQMYVFKRGQCNFRVDTDFSPCALVIENPWKPKDGWGDNE